LLFFLDYGINSYTILCEVCMLTQMIPVFRKWFPVFSVVFIMVWLTNLASTDSYFSVYTLIAFLSFFLHLRRTEESSCERRQSSLLCVILSIIFSILVLLANYPVFTQIGDPALIGRSTSILMNVINGVLSFVGGIFVAYPIISRFLLQFPTAASDHRSSRKWLPFLMFGSIFLFHLIHLLFVEFPGNLTEDSFTQISEMVSGSYSNFNTYWHTVLFQSVLSVGYAIFSDVNAAVAFFTVFQLLIMVFAFTYCLMTMVDYGIPGWAVFLSYLLFAIVPYNMALTITVWKDVLFAGGCLLLLSALVRIVCGLGRSSIWNYVVFIFGSVLFFVSRTNGWLIYLITFFAALVFLKRKKRLLVVMAVLSVVGWFMLNPALDMLGVEKGDLAESLSIPIQQVSCVIADGGELTQEEEQLLDRIVDLEEVPALYTNWISDPMKVEVRSKDYVYFQDNLSEYTKLWFRLGLRYPVAYVKAWVDQTKGYWNGGYDYAMYSETVTDNPYGVEKSVCGSPIASLFRLYFGLSRHLIFFEPLHSIGLHVWVFLLCFVLNIRSRRELWIICVPLLLLLVGMWLGTPVFSCFRYVYPLFISMPLIVSTSVWKQA